MMEAPTTSEISVNVYQTRRKVPEDSRPFTRRHGNVKSYKVNEIKFDSENYSPPLVLQKAWPNICDKLTEIIVTSLLVVIDVCRLSHNGVSSCNGHSVASAVVRDET